MIRGEGVGLRVPVPADRERWLELLHDPEQMRFGSPVFITIPETVDELDERIAEAAASFEAGEPSTLTIVEGDDPRFVGNVGWRRDAPAALRICEIGYSVHPDARGRGVARRAIRVFTRWLTAGRRRPSPGAGPARPQRREHRVLPGRAGSRLRA